MNGLLGSYNLIAGNSQSVYVCDTLGGSVVTLNVCNRGTSVAYVDVAISDTVNSPAASEWIEYSVELQPKAVLERTAIALNTGQYLTVRSSKSNVNAVCWGITIGDVDNTVNAITVNNNNVAPAWVTGSALSTIYAGNATNIQLSATDYSTVTYSVTSGTLPTGLSLNSATGLISGTPVTSGGTTPSSTNLSFTVSASDGALSTPQVFNITKKWADGASSTYAAPSAQAIKTLTGTNTDGVYWIDLPVVGATQIYCVMNAEVNGGGWMMMMKATRDTTFQYSSNLWTTPNLLNETDLNQNDGGAKFHSMNYFQGKDFYARWPDITTVGGSVSNQGCWTWLQNNYYNGRRITPIEFFRTAGNYAYTTSGVPYGGHFIQTAKSFSGWQNNIFSSQVDINFYGFNFINHPNYGLSAKVRWGFGFNENSEGNYQNPDTLARGGAPGSNDVSGGIGMDVSFGNYSAGDRVNCCQDFTGTNRSARVEVYVR